MKKSLLIGMAAMCLLASCGSDDDGTPIAVVPGGTPTPTPSPSPSPTATPTPTPTPASYTAFADLTGDRTFQTGCAALDYSTSPSTALIASDFGEGVGISYAASRQSYTVSGEGRTQVFGAANLDASAPAGTISYVIPGANNQADRFALAAPVAGGSSLIYTRVASIVSSSTQPTLQAVCALGVPTVPTDVPAVTSVTFSKTVAVGTSIARNAAGALLPYNLRSSTVTLTVNLVTGDLTGTLTLIGTPQVGGGGDVTLGTFAISGSIDDEENLYYGTIDGPNNSVVGNFGGAFFGPKGLEFGFSYNVTTDNNGSVGLVAAGAAFGSQ